MIAKDICICLCISLKIEFQVRRDNFPVIRSDWFLDRIIVERNRDSVKVTFICHCWLRTEQPDITLSVFSGIINH